jgi:hypothetical protein
VLPKFNFRWGLRGRREKIVFAFMVIYMVTIFMIWEYSRLPYFGIFWISSSFVIAYGLDRFYIRRGREK